MNATLQRTQLYRLLGDLPARDRTISARRIDEEQRDGYVLETLVLDLNGFEPVPAYFVRPIDAAGKRPTILYNHAHGGRYDIGKAELLAGNKYLQDPPYAQQLTHLGYNALCIDHWVFGQRRGRTESSVFKQMLWEGRVLWGMMVYDSLRAFDYLLTRDDVDPDRVGTLGLSMGSTMAWWAAALEERIRVCVDLCCLSDYRAIIEHDALDAHGIYYYVPGLLKQFTTATINALIAPRAHLSLAGNNDALTPPDGLDRIDRQLKAVYAEANAAEAWKLLRYDVGHEETPEMRAEIVAFLRKWL